MFKLDVFLRGARRRTPCRTHATAKEGCLRACSELEIIIDCREASHEAHSSTTHAAVLRPSAQILGHAPPANHPAHGSKDASRTPRTAEDASAAQLRISTRPAGRGDANARLGPKRPHGDAPQSRVAS